jgi:hypothetical protein
MRYIFLIGSLLAIVVPSLASAHSLPAARTGGAIQATPSTSTFVEETAHIKPSDSPFTFVPLSDFKNFGVSTSYRVEGVFPSDSVMYQLKYCESRIYDAYRVFPAAHRSELKRLMFLWTANTQRGLGGDGAIHLKCNDISDEELTSVFVHEMGHIVDTGVLGGHSAAGMSAYVDPRSSVFKDDPSIDFYSVSWRSAKAVHKGSTANDFVTIYGMSNPFEDFAETYNFYLLHGSQFKFMASSNKRLGAKYDYMKRRIFDGKEFANNDFKLNSKRRNYDSTLLPFSLANFVKSV